MAHIGGTTEDTERQARISSHVAARELPRPLPRPRVNEQAQAARMRDLEALASTACEENERLERELADVRVENTDLLRRLSMLEEAIANPRRVLGLPELDAPPPIATPRRGGRLVLSLLGVSLLIAPVVVLRPWQPIASGRAGMLGVGLWSEPRHRVIETLDAARRLVGSSTPAPVVEQAPVIAPPAPVIAPPAPTIPVVVATVAAAPVALASVEAPLIEQAPKHRAHSTRKHSHSHSGRHGATKQEAGSGPTGGLDL